MARKSRRNNNLKPINQLKKIEPRYRAGAYVRISVEDQDERNSISTQKEIIENYVYQHEDIKIHQYYIDNGISSFQMNRPAFERMQEDIKAGIIDCVIVKDLSRFGRDYLETGNYLETIYPILEVRFIAIHDGYDSRNERDMSQMLALRSLINHYYSLDISMKVKTVVNMKQLNGNYVPAQVPYGYKKQKIDGNISCVIDENAASTIKQIFQLALEGNSSYLIATKLNEQSIPSPKYYRKNMDISQWTAKTVKRILKNSSYTGDYIVGKTKSNLIGIRKVVTVPMDEWIVIPNYKEAIIERELFNQVNEKQEAAINEGNERNNVRAINHLKSTDEKSKTEDDDSFIKVISDLLYCGECGRKMKRKNWKGRLYYTCPRNEEAKRACITKSFRLDRFESELFRQLKSKQCELKRDYKKHERQQSSLNGRLKSQHYETKLNEVRDEIERYEALGISVYEHYIEQEADCKTALRQMMLYKNRKLLILKEEQEEILRSLKLMQFDKSDFLSTLDIILENKNNEIIDCKDINELIDRISIFNIQIKIHYKNH